MFLYHGHDCYLIYRFEKQCPIECGSHGFCTEQSGQMVCECDAGWTSNNCSIPTCSVECDNNSCDAKMRKCNCTNGYTGLCSNISSFHMWEMWWPELLMVTVLGSELRFVVQV